MKYLAYGIVWVATSVAVVVAINITKTATPLWAMLIPAMITLESGRNNDEKEGEGS